VQFNFVIQNIIFTFAPLFYSVVLKFENQYIIHFKGLKEGVHSFEYNIGRSFFEEYLNLDVPDGYINVKVSLTKKVHFMELSIVLSGNMMVQCDRCLDYFSMPVSYEGFLMVRFGEEEEDVNDEVMVLHPEEHQIDLKHYLYECISLAIPMRKVHPDLSDGSSGCSKEMLDKLGRHIIMD